MTYIIIILESTALNNLGSVIFLISFPVTSSPFLTIVNSLLFFDLARHVPAAKPLHLIFFQSGRLFLLVFHDLFLLFSGPFFNTIFPVKTSRTLWSKIEIQRTLSFSSLLYFYACLSLHNTDLSNTANWILDSIFKSNKSSFCGPKHTMQRLQKFLLKGYTNDGAFEIRRRSLQDFGTHVSKCSCESTLRSPAECASCVMEGWSWIVEAQHYSSREAQLQGCQGHTSGPGGTWLWVAMEIEAEPQYLVTNGHNKWWVTKSEEHYLREWVCLD